MPDFWPDEIARGELYEDIGSHVVPGPYDDCGHVKCEVCKAPAGSKCINPCTGKPRKLPCVGRIVRSTPRKEKR